MEIIEIFSSSFTRPTALTTISIFSTNEVIKVTVTVIVGTTRNRTINTDFKTKITINATINVIIPTRLSIIHVMIIVVIFFLRPPTQITRKFFF